MLKLTAHTEGHRVNWKLLVSNISVKCGAPPSSPASWEFEKKIIHINILQADLNLSCVSLKTYVSLTAVFFYTPAVVRLNFA